MTTYYNYIINSNQNFMTTEKFCRTNVDKIRNIVTNISMRLPESKKYFDTEIEIYINNLNELISNNPDNQLYKNILQEILECKYHINELIEYYKILYENVVDDNGGYIFNNTNWKTATHFHNELKKLEYFIINIEMLIKGNILKQL